LAAARSIGQRTLDGDGFRAFSANWPFTMASRSTTLTGISVQPSALAGGDAAVPD